MQYDPYLLWKKQNSNGCGKLDVPYTIRPDSGCTLAIMTITGRNQNASGSDPVCLLGKQSVLISNKKGVVGVGGGGVGSELWVCVCGGGGGRAKFNKSVTGPRGRGSGWEWAGKGEISIMNIHTTLSLCKHAFERMFFYYY